jgi:hypothetical protein
MQCDADNQPGSLGTLTQESDALMLTVFRGLVGGLHNCWVEHIRGKLDEKDMVRLVGERASLAHVRHGPGRQEILSIIEMTRKTLASQLQIAYTCTLRIRIADTERKRSHQSVRISSRDVGLRSQITWPNFCSLWVQDIQHRMVSTCQTCTRA